MCCGKRNIVVVHIGGSPIRDSYMVHRCGSHARVRACRNRHDSRAGCNILCNEYRNPSAAVAVRILIKANTEAPTVIVDAEGYAYNECASAGSKSLSELIVSHDGTLQWYDAAGNPLGTGASFDTSEAGETTYYASSISADGCESAKAEVKVRVLANSSALTTTSAVSEDGTFATCQATGSSILAWSDLIAAPHGVLNWYSDEDLQNPVPEPQVDLSVAQDVTYYVRQCRLCLQRVRGCGQQEPFGTDCFA